MVQWLEHLQGGPEQTRDWDDDERRNFFLRTLAQVLVARSLFTVIRSPALLGARQDSA